MNAATPTTRFARTQATTLADLALDYCSTQDRVERSRQAYELDQGVAAQAEAALIRAMVGAGTACVLYGDRGLRVLRGASGPKIELFSVALASSIALPPEADDF